MSRVLSRGLCLAVFAAACIGCGSRLGQEGHPPSSRASAAPQLDSMIVVVLNRPIETVRLTVVRHGGESITTLIREPGRDRPGAMLDSIGPVTDDPEKVRELLRTFDVWAMNAPDAPGAACTTIGGQRNCTVAHHDYSIVMMVRSGRQARAQRYIDLHSTTSSPQARALGAFILDWAHEREDQ